MICPNCQQEGTLVSAYKIHECKYRGRKLAKTVRGTRCMSCGESRIYPECLEEYEQIYEEFIKKVNKETENLTCVTCLLEPDCPYRWDLYNTNGDCLAMK